MEITSKMSYLDLDLFIRTKKFQEELCVHDLRKRIGVLIDGEISHSPGVVFFTLKDFFSVISSDFNINTTVLNKRYDNFWKELLKLSYALEVCALVGQIEWDCADIKETGTDLGMFLREYPKKCMKRWHKARSAWQLYMQEMAVLEDKKELTIALRLKNILPTPKSFKGSHEMEKYLGEGLLECLSGYKVDLKHPELFVRALGSKTLVFGIVLTSKQSQKDFNTQRKQAKQAKRTEATCERNDDIIDLDTLILDGVLGKIEGFSESSIRQKCKELKLGREAFLEEFRLGLNDKLLVDVRTPKEFNRGHIPGAVNIPVFSNHERASVGLCFHREGKNKALELGLTYVLPKLKTLAADYQSQLDKHHKSKLIIQCFRGGMRSQSVAWFLCKAGLSVQVLEKGYKGYKTWGRSLWDVTSDLQKYRVEVISGRTGVGKTMLLLELRQHGYQIIDLEGLANHKGSTFGHIPFLLKGIEQPSTEMYLNRLAAEWFRLDPKQPVFIEDEGHHIGNVCLPHNFYKNVLRNCNRVFRINLPVLARVSILVGDYASCDILELKGWMNGMIEAIKTASRRLGPERTATAIALIKESKVDEVAKLMLTYYDDLYDRHIESAGGTGSGTGERKSRIIEVFSNCQTFNGPELVNSIEKLL